jgi:hypothetical protein
VDIFFLKYQLKNLEMNLNLSEMKFFIFKNIFHKNKNRKRPTLDLYSKRKIKLVIQIQKVAKGKIIIGGGGKRKILSSNKFCETKKR